MDELSPYWNSRIVVVEEMTHKQWNETNGTLIDMLSQDLVKTHIWPKVMGSFSGVGDRNALVNVPAFTHMHTLRLVSKKWKFLVECSREWFALRMAKATMERYDIQVLSRHDLLLEMRENLSLLASFDCDGKPLHSVEGLAGLSDFEVQVYIIYLIGLDFDRYMGWMRAR